MKSITIRKVPEPVHRQLRVRAAKNGRSLEAELRAVLLKLARIEYDGAKAQPATPAAEDDDTESPIRLTERDLSTNRNDAMRKVRRILQEEMVEDANAA